MSLSERDASSQLEGGHMGVAGFIVVVCSAAGCRLSNLYLDLFGFGS